jgi:hypothetical protein
MQTGSVTRNGRGRLRPLARRWPAPLDWDVRFVEPRYRSHLRHSRGGDSPYTQSFGACMWTAVYLVSSTARIWPWAPGW